MDLPILPDQFAQTDLDLDSEAATLTAVDMGLASGYACRDAGDAAAAEASFRAALGIDPLAADARGALADLLADAGRWAEAADAFRAALSVEQGRMEWRIGLSDALVRSGDTDAAIEVWRDLLERRPDSAAAHKAMARLRVGVGQPLEALDHFREALFLDAGDADTAVELAEALVASGDPLAAVETLQPVLRRLPDHAAGLFTLGKAWLDLGERNKALGALRRCLDADADPDDRRGVAVLIASVEGDTTETMSQAYVRALFDRYAERFDEDLTIRLKYQAPQTLRAMVDQLLGADAAGLDVLDVGCGTGLAGVAFRSMAGRLHGSDLAPRMVEKARRRGVYDDLQIGELTAVLAREVHAWDLVIAADVLVYVGELGPVMIAAAAALKPGGLFCASTERCDGDGFALGPSRRFAHNPAYLRRMAVEAGLEIIVMEDAVARWEKGQPVPGLVFAARKPA
jgi:predicted TPR repeat methyltransferase